MKNILVMISIVYSTFSFGQIILYNDKPAVYLDSNKIDLEYFLFDQNKIERLDVVKQIFDVRTNTSGTIYITSKQPKSFNFFSYQQIKSRFFSDKLKPILLLLNGDFVKNPNKLNIDSSYIYKVEVESGADFEELKNIFSSLTIVNIQTRFTSSKNEQRNIKLGIPDIQIFLNGLPRESFPE